MGRDSSEIVRQVAADPGALSYVGLGYVKNQPIRTIEVAATAGGPAVPPNLDTVRRGTYPIYRPLLMYTIGTPGGLPRELLAFVLSEQGQRIVEPTTSSAPIHPMPS